MRAPNAAALRPRARVSLGFLALFMALMLAASALYPGGSWQHPHALGHHFFENYWCDLLRRPAHNGQPNELGAWLATAGMAALALALLPFWLEVSLLSRGAARAFLRVAGCVSAVATGVVALVPSDRFPSWHAPAVLAAGGLGFACGVVCSSAALARFRSAPAFAGASLLLLSAAAVNLVLYVRVAYFNGPDTIVLPSVQKLATLALLVWIVCGLQAAGTARRATLEA